MQHMLFAAAYIIKIDILK